MISFPMCRFLDHRRSVSQTHRTDGSGTAAARDAASQWFGSFHRNGGLIRENSRFLIHISIMNCRRNHAFRARLFTAICREKSMSTKSGGSKRGFAAMDPAKQREIASKGGKASHGGGRRPSTGR